MKENLKKERLYLNSFERWQESTSGTVETERETLLVSDDQKQFLQLETLTIDSGSTISTPTTNWRYQYDNYIGSASLETDASANVISYEEYHPFGTSSYRSGSSAAEVKLRNYRYVGKERDEETGLYNYGARLYFASIGRFISSDLLRDSYPYLNSYNYAGNKPITYYDIDGMQSSEDDVIEIVDGSGQKTLLDGGSTISEDGRTITGPNGSKYLNIDGIGLVNEAFLNEKKYSKAESVLMAGMNLVAENLYSGNKRLIDLTEEEKVAEFESNANNTTAILMMEFVTGTSPNEPRIFTDKHPITQEISRSFPSRIALEKLEILIKEGKVTEGEWLKKPIDIATSPDRVEGKISLPAHIEPIFTGEVSAFYRGGMRYNFKIEGETINVRVTDTYTTDSGIRSGLVVPSTKDKQIPLESTRVEFRFTYSFPGMKSIR